MPEISEEELQSLNEAKSQLSSVESSVETLKGEMDNLKVAKSDLERKLDDADKELLSEKYLDFKNKPSPTSKEDGDIDFDAASGREIANHLMGKSKGNLEKAIKEVTSRIEKNEEQMGRAFAQLDVTLTALRHSDFDANKDAIYKVAKDNPSWGAEKCYSQWKMENKVAIDRKLEEDKKKEEEERKAITERGGGMPSSSVKDKQLSNEEAASAAYDKAFGNS